MDNYCVNGVWFEAYSVARTYAEDLLEMEGKYYVVFTKAEMDSIKNAIDHEMECGK